MSTFKNQYSLFLINGGKISICQIFSNTAFFTPSGCEDAGGRGRPVATLWFPYRFLVMYNSFATHRYMELWFLMFCKTIIFNNSAINPILYNAMSIKFRKAFKKLLSCDKLDINHAPS
ncbi:thyroliberin receptor [Caerostris extrusa]|uniref:Thyroliberin receptor n=1 Tax=Caerostris extrusa TaxID=172846 RepID=A0AAV4QMF5_CAEEX|nr:thyroliberin receptor [Caerostris extrusa]